MFRKHKWAIGAASFLLLLAASFALWFVFRGPSATGCVEEYPVLFLPIRGKIQKADAEISSIAWHKKTLFILPQHPERFASASAPDGQVFALPEDDLRRAVRAVRNKKRNGDTDSAKEITLKPRLVPLDLRAQHRSLEGYDGLEAIVFSGDRFFVTVELDSEKTRGRALVWTGKVIGQGTSLVVDPTQTSALPAQTTRANTSYEALLAYGDRIAAFYELNRDGNPHPHVEVRSLDLKQSSTIPFPKLPYRVTDVTAVDGQSRFWAVNYFWPGSGDMPEPCPLTKRFGSGASHAKSRTVERIVEFRIDDKAVHLTEHPPLQLELNEKKARNWEAIARLKGEGFLLMTDKHPKTIMAFVPYPGS